MGRMAYCYCFLNTQYVNASLGSVNLTPSDPMSDFIRHYDFPVPDTFPHVVRTLANR
jgi:hypothetical protein